MAVLGRLKIAPNQRLDLPDIQAFDSYSAGDWMNFMQGLTGGNPFILQGFDVIDPATLINNPATQLNINMSAAAMWWPQGGEGSFFTALPGAPAESVSLITSATNYVQMRMALTSGAQDARALWDPGANGGAGGEFTQVVDTEYVLTVTLEVNNTGYDTDAVPLTSVVVNSSNVVTSITDGRPLLFRLGTGGANPDPSHSFLWPNVPLGYAQTDTPVTMTSSGDPNPFQGADKNITSLKAWMDAVMSRIKDIDGGDKWFQGSGAAPGSGGNLSLTELLLDSEAGHSPIPNRSVRFAWSVANDGIFRSLDAVGVNQAVSWKSNTGQLTWSLGGSFVSASNRAFATYTFAQAVAPGQNLYLHLERDVALNGDPNVTFQNINGTTGSVSSPATGSFVGVAVGDFVRKKSGSTFQYYQVLSIAVNNVTPFTNGTIFGTVADGTVQYMTIATHDGPILSTTEQYRYFRTQYTGADLLSSQYGVYDTSYYWIGANTAGMFFLRYYGDMQPGEETEVLDDSSPQMMGGGGGVSDLILIQSENAIYDPSTGYSLKGGATTTLLTLVRRLADNTVGNPSNSDNSGASPTYTIAAPVGTMNDGDGLWVRLSNSTSGVLTAGTVTNIATDNVYAKLPQSGNPLKVYNNLNVFLVARKYTINGVATLVFTDGVMLSLDGQWVNNHFSVQQDLFLKEKTQWSIPFIGTTTGRVDENNAEFFWNNTAGQDSLGQFGVRNIRISEDSVAHIDYFTQAVAQDVVFFGNLGNHTLTIGQNNSTTIIPGDLIVEGTSSSINTSTINITGKQIVVGVGNLDNGGGDSGLAVADNTISASQYATTNSQIYVDITYPSPHGYVTGNVVWVNANTALGGITAGELSAPYTVKVTGAVVGDAEVTGANTLRIWSHGTATSTATQAVTGAVVFESYLTPSSILMSDSSGNTTGMTSWAFQVKGVATTPTITPVSTFSVVPTASATNASTGNIPFLGSDAAGPSGANTTYSYSANLNWNNGTNTLTVGGGLSLAGNLDPAADNVYNLGETNLRWKTLHVGPGSVVVHNDATNTNWSKMDFNGATARFITDAATPMQVTTGANSGMSMDTAGRVGWFGAVSNDTSFYFIQSSVIATGTTQYGVRVSTLLNGTTETNNLHVQGVLQTNTTVDASEVRVANITLAAGALITNQYGVRIDNLTSGTNNYAVHSSVNVSAATKWFLYGVGTAPSYLNGGLGLGNNTASVNTQRLLLGTTADTTAAGGMSFGTDTTLYRAAAGSLKTDGNFTIGAMTLGSVLYAGTAGIVSQDNANFFWDASNHRLGLQTIVTTAALNIGTTASTAAVGGILLGTDTTLYRTGVSALKTDGSFTVGTTAGIGVAAGATVLTIGTNTAVAAGGVIFGTDSTLYRSAASTLKTDGTFVIGAAATVGTTLSVTGNTGLGVAASTSVLTIGTNTVTAAGGMSFGTDVPLYRGAATSLYLGANLIPQTDATWDLGQNVAPLRWRNLYLSGSIFLTGGSLNVNVSTVQTTTYTVLTTDTLVRYNTTAGGFTITLPTSVAGNKGQVVILKDVGGFIGITGKAMTLAPNGTDTIDGVNANIVVNFAPKTSLTLIADGAGGWTLN